jgi:uncharacterized protein with HEPN domain
VSRSDRERIADIFEAATELASVIAVGQTAFLADVVRMRAAERLLEIIGEASGTLSPDVTAQLPDVAWQDIARLRILLAHHYHRVDPSQVWTIATIDVPTLVDRLRTL